MRKTILLFIVFLTALSAKAQWYVGGGFSADFYESNNALILAPDFGYTFENTPLGIGLASQFDFYQYKPSGEKFVLKEICLSPYLRYYFCDIERLSFFVDLASDIYVLGEKGFNIGLLPGVSFDLTKHWSAEFYYGWIGYEQFDEKGFSIQLDSSTTRFSFTYNF